MIHDFIKDICDVLNIDMPDVSFDISGFQTATTLAQCSPDGSTIYIKESDKPDLDQLFSIAHELRHIWQIRNNKQLYFTDYKPADMCGSLEAYNLQIAEIDANAFAYIVIVDCFGVKPLFEGLPDLVRQKIIDRVDYLKSTL